MYCPPSFPSTSPFLTPNYSLNSFYKFQSVMDVIYPRPIAADQPRVTAYEHSPDFAKSSSQEESLKSDNDGEKFLDRIGESARNRFGRPYISGRPLLLCDRKKIIRLYREGNRKIAIAREIGVTHSCVSKVIRRFEESGEIESRSSRTASCACPGEAETHDPSVCRHVRFFRSKMANLAQKKYAQKVNQQSLPNGTLVKESRKLSADSGKPTAPSTLTSSFSSFSIEWILSDNCPRRMSSKCQQNFYH